MSRGSRERRWARPCIVARLANCRLLMATCQHMPLAHFARSINLSGFPQIYWTALERDLCLCLANLLYVPSTRPPCAMIPFSINQQATRRRHGRAETFPATNNLHLPLEACATEQASRDRCHGSSAWALDDRTRNAALLAPPTSRPCCPHRLSASTCLIPSVPV